MSGLGRYTTFVVGSKPACGKPRFGFAHAFLAWLRFRSASIPTARDSTRKRSCYCATRIQQSHTRTAVDQYRKTSPPVFDCCRRWAVLTTQRIGWCFPFTSISARGVRFSVRFRIYQMVHTSSLSRWPNEANAGERQGFAQKSCVALSHRPGVAQFHHSASP